MDTQQMFQELDRLYAQGKLDEAEEKMMGWMKEGLDSGNKSLCLMMCNEMEGLYRNTGSRYGGYGAVPDCGDGTGWFDPPWNDTFKCGNRAPDGRRCGESAFPVPGGGSDF